MVDEHSAEELSYLATSFAVALANDMDIGCIKVMCSFFVSVVGTLNLIIAQRGMLREKCERCERFDRPGPPKPSCGPCDPAPPRWLK